MSFGFAAPVMLWGLAAIIPLVAIYLFQQRRKPIEVGSLVLWQGVVTPSLGGRRIQRLDRPLSLLLETLLIIALVLWAAGPMLFTRTSNPLVIVLDDSFSMTAETNGTSARTRGLDRLDQVLQSVDASAIAVVLAGSEPRALASRASPTQARRAIEQSWTCFSPAADLRSAIQLAQDIGGGSSRLLVVTDAVLPDQDESFESLPANTRWLAVGAPAPNIAIVAARRDATATDEDALLIEFANASDAPATTEVILSLADGPELSLPEPTFTRVSRRQIGIDANARQILRLRVPAPESIISLALPSDALEIDNRVLLAPVRRDPLRVAIERDPQAEPAALAVLERAVLATGRAELVASDPELALRTRWLDEPTAAGSRAIVEFAREPADADPPWTSTVGPFTIERNEPLAEGIELRGVQLRIAPDADLAGLPWIYAGRQPVAAIDGSRVRFNLDLARSTLAESPAFPVLVWNLIQWRLNARPGPIERNLPLGAPLRVTSNSASRAARDPVLVTTPTGEQQAFDNTDVELPTRQPGLYRVTASGTTHTVAVNPLAPAESDLRDRATGEAGQWQPAQSAKTEPKPERDTQRRPLGWLLGLLALVIALLHAAILWPRSGGRSLAGAR